MFFLHQFHFSPFRCPHGFLVRSAVADVHIVDGEVVGVFYLADRTVEKSEQDCIRQILVLCCILAVETHCILRVISEHLFQIFVFEQSQVLIDLRGSFRAGYDDLDSLNIVVQP